jgi:hypothetical protein
VDTGSDFNNIHTEGRPAAGTVHLVQGIPSRANKGVYANSPCGEILIPTLPLVRYQDLARLFACPSVEGVHANFSGEIRIPVLPLARYQAS